MFNVAFKHLRSYFDVACSSDTLTDVLPHRIAMLQTQDMTPQPRHSKQTQGRPVAVLSIDVKLHSGRHSYPFECLGRDSTGKSFPDLPHVHTPANAQLDAVMMVISRELGRKYRTNLVLNPGPVVCESITI